MSINYIVKIVKFYCQSIQKVKKLQKIFRAKIRKILLKNNNNGREFDFSFVQEFSSPPAEGITLLLETLRGVQLAQTSPPSGQSGPRVGTRRAALDELGCVECLAACGERCADAPRLLAQAQPGLLALAVCLTSSLNRSRVLALQVCKTTASNQNSSH